jgi:hypothetical protein
VSSWGEYTIDGNGTYYFTNNNGVFTSNNAGVNSTTAYTRLKIDLTSETSNVILRIYYTVSSESGYDYGTCHATNTTAQPSYSDSAGRFVYVSGSSSGTDTYTLSAGQIWYLHMQYRKDSSQASGNDNFKITEIEI